MKGMRIWRFWLLGNVGSEKKAGFHPPNPESALKVNRPPAFC